MRTRYFILICTLIFIAISSFGQTKKKEFISVYISKSCPVVPFAKTETEIANYKVCQRNILPPRRKMNKEQLDCYDTWNTKSKYAIVDTADYDSIANYILTSGILEINLDYELPDTTGELILMYSGACSKKYVIETSKKRIEFPISGANDFALPQKLIDFDNLFRRITGRYQDKYE